MSLDPSNNLHLNIEEREDMIIRVNRHASVNITRKVGRKRVKQQEQFMTKPPKKKLCETPNVQEKPLTTETLDVPGVAVVTDPKGKSFLGPFYSDQFEMLRSTLRKMPRRDKFVVATVNGCFWIYRNPEWKTT